MKHSFLQKIRASALITPLMIASLCFGTSQSFAMHSTLDSTATDDESGPTRKPAQTGPETGDDAGSKGPGPMRAFLYVPKTDGGEAYRAQKKRDAAEKKKKEEEEYRRWLDQVARDALMQQYAWAIEQGLLPQPVRKTRSAPSMTVTTQPRVLVRQAAPLAQQVVESVVAPTASTSSGSGASTAEEVVSVVPGAQSSGMASSVEVMPNFAEYDLEVVRQDVAHAMARASRKIHKKTQAALAKRWEENQVLAGPVVEIVSQIQALGAELRTAITQNEKTVGSKTLEDAMVGLKALDAERKEKENVLQAAQESVKALTAQVAATVAQCNDLIPVVVTQVTELVQAEKERLEQERVRKLEEERARVEAEDLARRTREAMEEEQRQVRAVKLALAQQAVERAQQQIAASRAKKMDQEILALKAQREKKSYWISSEEESWEPVLRAFQDWELTAVEEAVANVLMDADKAFARDRAELKAKEAERPRIEQRLATLEETRGDDQRNVRDLPASIQAGQKYLNAISAENEEGWNAQWREVNNLRKALTASKVNISEYDALKSRQRQVNQDYDALLVRAKARRDAIQGQAKEMGIKQRVEARRAAARNLLDSVAGAASGFAVDPDQLMAFALEIRNPNDLGWPIKKTFKEGLEGYEARLKTAEETLATTQKALADLRQANGVQDTKEDIDLSRRLSSALRERNYQREWILGQKLVAFAAYAQEMPKILAALDPTLRLQVETHQRIQSLEPALALLKSNVESERVALTALKKEQEAFEAVTLLRSAFQNWYMVNGQEVENATERCVKNYRRYNEEGLINTSNEVKTIGEKLVAAYPERAAWYKEKMTQIQKNLLDLTRQWVDEQAEKKRQEQERAERQLTADRDSVRTEVLRRFPDAQDSQYNQYADLVLQEHYAEAERQRVEAQRHAYTYNTAHTVQYAR